MNARWKLPALALAAAASLAVPALAAEYYYDPVTRTYQYVDIGPAAPPIVIEAPPLTEDEAITNDVVASLAADPRLDDGRIGVETFRNEVTLSGRVDTLRHMDIAEGRAAEVPGVREVHNHLRPGGMRLLTR